MRWVDGVYQDSETIGETYWRSQANDKDKSKPFWGRQGPAAAVETIIVRYYYYYYYYYYYDYYYYYYYYDNNDVLVSKFQEGILT